MSGDDQIAFGPVPSRRLGRSLGINNIPPKICTYSCVYCQLGRTRRFQVDRGPFYEIEKIVEGVREKIKRAGDKGVTVDYLTFVPDGEPTLDINLGEEIGALGETGIKIAVITNASLVWRGDVRDDLGKADWVSLKVDAVSDDVWRKINRPNRMLVHSEILRGATEFSRAFDGELATETMLVEGVNDSVEELGGIADFIAGLKPGKAYISIPIRPPAETWVGAPSGETVNIAYNIFRERGIDVELITGHEGNAFASTGDAEADILSITSVHPMREDSVRALLERSGADWAVVERLLGENKLLELKYKNRTFYLRNLSASGRDASPE